MAFRINIGSNGKTWKIESDSEDLVGKKIGEKVHGKEIDAKLEGFEFEITGTSDSSGFAGKKDLDIPGTKRELLLAGNWGCWQEPKGLRKTRPQTRDGLRLRKTVRGNTISRAVVQINVSVKKEGHKKLEELFPEQNQPKVKEEEVKVEVAPVAQ